MVVIATLALISGVARMALEHGRHQKIREHRQTISRQHGLMRQVEEGAFLASYTPEEIHKQTAIVRYHGAMEQKYLKGATEPWVDLPPDPPEPPPFFDFEQFQREVEESRDQMRRLDERIEAFMRERAGRP